MCDLCYEESLVQRREIERLRAERLYCDEERHKALGRAEQAEARLARVVEAARLIESWRPARGEAMSDRLPMGKLTDDVAALQSYVEDLEARLARVMEAADRVLSEAGLQAHKVGCHNRLMRTRISQGTEGECQGCKLESLLAAAQPEDPNEQHLRAHPEYPREKK